MKISPVAGTPTIPQPSSTGLSPEKIQRLKTIAAGQTPGAEETAPEQKTLPKEPSIKMQTNRTPEPVVAAQPEATTAEVTQENAISDTDVQTKPEPEDTQQVSPQVAALAKEKRAFQIKEKELTDRERALDEREKALGAKGQGRAELEKKVQAGQALSVLEDLGITYDQLTNELLGRQNAPDLTAFEESILKKIEERFANRDTAQEEAVFKQMRKNVERLSSSDDYPFVKAEQAQEKVLELIKRAWHENEEVIDEEEAIGLIEAELKEKAKSYARLLEAKIIKEPEQTTQAAAEKSPKPQNTGIKTLTNKDSARAGMSRRQRAIAAALGQKQMG